ncbi:HU family DNA-binding protein [Bacteroides sp.]|uniref:HU family DNA-binding protein n=1 Tax=Bacteroides sp. TaxID=29523 RepID=UPI002633FC7C|nr:HU family DNA-binding protein [Bacteroides sp.]MDD3038990.1 DNA-binding protein [Bacteroides sp.]
MAADYDFLRKPNKNGDGELQPLYPRIVSKGTIDSKQLFREIAGASSFTEGDLAGIMVSLQEKVSYYLSEGYHVKLGEFGYFSASLKARPVMDKKEIRSVSISFDNINFRATRWFRRYSSGTVSRAKSGFQQSSDLPEETRHSRLKAFLAKNHFITRREYTQLTGLLKGKALRELNNLVDIGVLTTRGTGNRIVYLTADNQNIK